MTSIPAALPGPHGHALVGGWQSWGAARGTPYMVPVCDLAIVSQHQSGCKRGRTRTDCSSKPFLSLTGIYLIPIGQTSAFLQSSGTLPHTF